MMVDDTCHDRSVAKKLILDRRHDDILISIETVKNVIKAIVSLINEKDQS